MSHNIQLRMPIMEDLDLLLDLENDLKQAEYTDLPGFYTKEQMEQFLDSDHDLFINQQLRYIITVDSKLAGCVDLYNHDVVNSRVGIGIFVLPEFRKKGVAVNAIEQVKKLSRTKFYLKQIFATISSINTKSITLFEKSGFEKTGVRKDWIRTEDSFVDVYFYQCFL